MVVCSRVFVTMIMNLQTEPYIRFGLNMMKYANNHPEEFSVPGLAALIGFMYCGVSLLISFSCIIKICNQSTVMDTLKSFVPYAAVAFVPNFVFMALPLGHPIKSGVQDLTIKNRRRNIEKRDALGWMWRCIYKTLRIFYCSFWFYFNTVLPIILPFVMYTVPSHPGILSYNSA